MKKSKLLPFLVLLVLLAIGASRLPGLMHGSDLHTDEMVFLRSAQNLSAFLLGNADTYKTAKFYPEGGFTLHTPMQLVRMVCFTGLSSVQAGRLTGLIFFLMGVLLGFVVLRRFFTRDRSAAVIYFLIMAFGLIHVEQSRYATGDTATFFFLMVLLYQSFRGMERRKMRHFLYACIAGGVLCAIKYPLVYFLLIPYLGFRKTFAGEDKKFIFKNTWLAALCCLLGFLLLSPKTLTDPTYLFWTAAHETHNYMAGTNLTEVGGPHNHLIAVAAYTLLYSGMPLMAGAVIWQWVGNIRRFKEMDGTALMRDAIIPGAALGFAVYNLFVTAVFMRTYYPFFCIMELYCASLGAKWWHAGGRRKLLLSLLCAFMILRGGMLLTILGCDDGTQTMLRFMEQVNREDYSFITELKPGHMAFEDADLPMAVIATDLKDDRFARSLSLQEGELLISTYQAHGICKPYPLPIFSKAVNEYIALWRAFRQENAPYYLGQLYPDWYYSLFGFDIKGTTGTIFEFPANQFYLKPISK